jgi:hypothetical protein
LPGKGVAFGFSASHIASMPLVSSVLKDQLQRFMDAEYPLFVDYPVSQIDSAAKWAEAIMQYAQSVGPASATHLQARNAMQGVLAGVTNAAGNGATLFSQGLASYASVMGAGMTGFVATPPIIPVNIVPVFNLGMAGADAATCTQALATAVDIWFHLGTAVPIGGGSTINWF